jgi:adenosylhomocysteine nucleosidase
VVIASEMRFHDVDVTAFGYEMGQMAQQPAAFPCDEKLIALAQACIAEQGKHQTKVGLICTGDQFMCKPDAIAKARADFPQMLAVEMEGAAIGQVCHMFKVPYLVVRAMSDIAGKDQVESFDAFIEVAGQHSAEVIIALLGKL